jgi:hypothetical protein
MSLVNAGVGCEVVSTLLHGAQLDTIRVYSLAMQLGFVRPSAVDGLPNEVWVSLSGTLCLEGTSSILGDAEPPKDFFEHRASILGAVYLLIGREVTSACVSDSGALLVHLGSTCLSAAVDKDMNLEEVWSVMSDSSESTADHQWYVSFDGSGALSVRTPYLIPCSKAF